MTAADEGLSTCSNDKASSSRHKKAYIDDKDCTEGIHAISLAKDYIVDRTILSPSPSYASHRQTPNQRLDPTSLERKSNNSTGTASESLPAPHLFKEKTADALPTFPLTPSRSKVFSASSSSLSSLPSTPEWPSPGRQPIKEDRATSPSPIPRKRKPPLAKHSPYFPSPPPSKHKPRRTPTSCIPFPPLTSPTFGLIQESLTHAPFHSLLATIFLTKTRGAVALPHFWSFIKKYGDPQKLAQAEIENVRFFFEHLGLQNQRANRCISLARIWAESPPCTEKRWKKVGKRLVEVAVDGEGEGKTEAWEIGHLPVGKYGVDSWRMFCRDSLRGLKTVDPPQPDEGRVRDAEGEQPEWSRCLPQDKELRAYLRWRWLKLGWEWHPVTGEKKKADKRLLERAKNGGVVFEGEDGSWKIKAEDKYGEDDIRRIGSFSKG